MPVILDILSEKKGEIEGLAMNKVSFTLEEIENLSEPIAFY